MTIIDLTSPEIIARDGSSLAHCAEKAQLEPGLKQQETVIDLAAVDEAAQCIPVRQGVVKEEVQGPCPPPLEGASAATLNVDQRALSPTFRSRQLTGGPFTSRVRFQGPGAPFYQLWGEPSSSRPLIEGGSRSGGSSSAVGQGEPIHRAAASMRHTPASVAEPPSASAALPHKGLKRKLDSGYQQGCSKPGSEWGGRLTGGLHCSTAEGSHNQSGGALNQLEGQHDQSVGRNDQLEGSHTRLGEVSNTPSTRGVPPAGQESRASTSQVLSRGPGRPSTLPINTSIRSSLLRRDTNKRPRISQSIDLDADPQPSLPRLTSRSGAASGMLGLAGARLALAGPRLGQAVGRRGVFSDDNIAARLSDGNLAGSKSDENLAIELSDEDLAAKMQEEADAGLARETARRYEEEEASREQAMQERLSRYSMAMPPFPDNEAGESMIPLDLLQERMTQWRNSRRIARDPRSARGGNDGVGMVESHRIRLSNAISSLLPASLYGAGPDGDLGGEERREGRMLYPRHSRMLGYPFPGFLREEMLGIANSNLPRSLLFSDRDFTADDYDMLCRLDEGVENRKGATQDTIDSLPTQVVCRGGNRSGKADDCGEVPNCSICLEDAEEGSVLRSLPCCHKFHRDCIDRWLKQKAVCPVCQRPAAGLQD
eukprot:gene14666-20701_t